MLKEKEVEIKTATVHISQQSRKTDSLISFVEEGFKEKGIQTNILNLPGLEDEDELLIRHQASFDHEIEEFE